MEADNINFKQYKTAANTKLQKTLLFCSLVISVICLAIEIGMFLTLIIMNQSLDSKVLYVIIRIVFPTVFNFTSLIIAYKVFKNKRITIEIKSYAVSLSFFTIASVVSIFHNYFSILLVAPSFVFFIASIFGSKKLIKHLGILIIPVFVLECVTFMLDKETGPMVYRVLTLVCTMCIIVVSYNYSKQLVETTANQLEYIHKNYRTQSLLIEELKIEPMTKLYNRVAFENTVTRILRRFGEDEICPYMVVIDLDFFKKVNDIYGHTAGDEVLIRLASIMKKNMGGPRQAFRYGGEEFVLLFDDGTKESVLRITEKIRTDFEAETYDFAPDLHVTLSAGVAEYTANLSGKDWFDHADKALYEAKSSGRNRVVVYSC